MHAESRMIAKQLDAGHFRQRYTAQDVDDEYAKFVLARTEIGPRLTIGGYAAAKGLSARMRVLLYQKSSELKRNEAIQDQLRSKAEGDQVEQPPLSSDEALAQPHSEAEQPQKFNSEMHAELANIRAQLREGIQALLSLSAKLDAIDSKLNHPTP